jgi:hypothetical protein
MLNGHIVINIYMVRLTIKVMSVVRKTYIQLVSSFVLLGPFSKQVSHAHAAFNSEATEKGSQNVSCHMSES